MTTDDTAKMQMKEHQRLSKQLWIASAFTDASSDDKSESTVACDKHNLKILFIYRWKLIIDFKTQIKYKDAYNKNQHGKKVKKKLKC